MLIILWLFGIWRKSERWKSSVSGCLMSWPQIKNPLKCRLLLLYATTMNHFSIGLWRVMKSGFYKTMVITSSVIGLRRSSKALPKAKLASKKGYGHCLVVCCLSDPLQLSESQWNHYNWEGGSANQWDAPKTATLAAGQQNGPNSFPWQCSTAHRKSNVSKVERTGGQSFASSTIFTWALINQLPWQLFAGKNFLQPAGGRKCFPRTGWILKHQFLCYRNKQT